MRVGEQGSGRSGGTDPDLDASPQRLPLPENLRSPEGLLRTILDNTTDALILVDALGRIRWSSPSVRDVLGFEPDVGIGHHVLEYVHADDVGAALPSLLRLTAGATNAEPVVVRARHADGEWRWVEALAKRVSGDPATTGAMFSVRDVTARVEAERARQRSEARLSAYLENSKDITVRVEADATIEWVSGNVEDMLGYRPDELIGQPAFGLIEDDSVDEALERFAEVLADAGPPTPLVLDVRRRDGTSLTVEALGTLLPEEGVQPGVLVNIRDATWRIETEQALRASEARFRTVMHNSYDVVALIDAEATITWVTANCERLLGWTPDEVVGTSGVDYVHPDDVEAMLGELASFVAGDGVPNPTTIKMLHKDGTWQHVELVGTDLLDNPDIGGIALNLRGVNERVAAEQDRRRLTDIFELTSDLVGITTAEGEIVYLNEAARTFFGLPDDVAADAGDITSRFTEASRGRLTLEAQPELTQGVQWTGELEMRRADGVVVPMLSQMLAHRDANGRVEYISGVYRDISERKAFESRLEHEATHDPLTGLPNRSLLLDRLEQALARARRRDCSVGVLFCDLDHFKVVNDSRGHSTGDLLLTEIARRLDDQLRPGDTVSRFGGDEFVILCEDLAGADDAVAIAERVEQAMEGGFLQDQGGVHVGMSIGIALADRGHGDAEALIRDADAAMYRAKSRGRNRYHVFEAGMLEEAIERFDVENALRRALDRDEFELHYQPVIDLTTGQICSIEALVRWRHPERGLLLPAEFLDVAEETGTIVPLGAWVLREACRQLATWQAHRPDLPLTVSVNLSARQLEPELVGQVINAIRASAIAPGLLDLEINEGVLMDVTARAEPIVAQLRLLGVHLSIDNFGTGFSSLSHLRRFSLDHVKVDRSFVDGLGVDDDTTAVLGAIIDLTHTLRMKATAKGVETHQQLGALEVMGCDQAQGFGLAEPGPPAAVAALLGIPADPVDPPDPGGAPRANRLLGLAPTGPDVERGDRR